MPATKKLKEAFSLSNIFNTLSGRKGMKKALLGWGVVNAGLLAVSLITGFPVILGGLVFTTFGAGSSHKNSKTATNKKTSHQKTTGNDDFLGIAALAAVASVILASTTLLLGMAFSRMFNSNDSCYSSATAAQTAGKDMYKNKTTFDYDSNNGTFMVGQRKSRMGISFTQACGGQIYLYGEGYGASNANVSSIARVKNAPPGKTLNIDDYDHSSGVYDLRLGDTFIVRNDRNYCAQGRIDSIQAEGYNSNNDSVTFQYQVKKCLPSHSA